MSVSYFSFSIVGYDFNDDTLVHPLSGALWTLCRIEPAVINTINPISRSWLTKRFDGCKLSSPCVH